MDRTDAELMHAWQRGDAAAFTILVRRWQQPMARFLAHLVGPTGQVADLCQEVFLRLHTARYREAGSFSTWLYRIALNVARDAGRRRRRMPVSLDVDGLLGCAPTPESLCERHEIAELVSAAIAELPEPLREVLVLHHYEELNFTEIARLTGTPASTLKSRFAAALARLRQRLHHLNGELEDPNP